jgi:acetyl-CoA carboxylase biotin carboxyl carrier protein
VAEVKVLSEIAGTVWLVETEVGASVEEDDTIMILESMKMEIPVDAPESGKVVKILVAKGDAVSENQEVAILET